MHEPTRRLFIGIAPPSDTAKRWEDAARASLAGPAARRLAFLDAPDVHVTLLFLGAVQESAVAGLSSALAHDLASFPALDLVITGTGAFPGAARPRVLWAGVEEVPGSAGGLADLRAGILRSVRAARVEVSARETEGPFRPHLTLARVRSPLRAEETRAFFELAVRDDWHADEVVLFESGTQREPAGTERSRYARILRVPLRPR